MKKKNEGKIIDWIIYVMTIISLVIIVPQVFMIFLYQDVSRVSFISWSSFLLLGIGWFLFGVSSRYKPIVIFFAIWILVEIIVITGAVFYR